MQSFKKPQTLEGCQILGMHWSLTL